MDTRTSRISILAATLLAAALLATTRSAGRAAPTPPDVFAPARQGLRCVTQLIRVVAPPRQAPVPVITTGVRG